MVLRTGMYSISKCGVPVVGLVKEGFMMFMHPKGGRLSVSTAPSLANKRNLLHLPSAAYPLSSRQLPRYAT